MQLFLIAVVLVEFSCASPIVQPKLKDGYVETGQCEVMAVYNHWTGLVNWTGGLTLKIIFMFF